jgi:peptide/nickel transport system substrate-binding protein
MRQVWIQYHPARVGNPALRDVRLRRALVHAIDRTSLADVVSGGASPVAETLVAPADPLYPRVQQAIISYPFDRTRALALLAEVGWTRSPAGALVDSRGEQFAIEYLTSRVSDNVTEMEIIGNDLAAIGFNVAQVAYAQRSRTNEEEASFPGLFFTPIRNMQVPEGLSEFTTDQCPTAERRFIGNNRACWNDPDYERLFSLASAAFDEGERANATVDALKVLTQGVPVIPLSYNIEYVGVRKGLQGPVPRWPAQRGYTWNIHEWRWT